MTDQSAYVNAYLESAMAMLHDQLNQVVQLKTQVKLSENLLSQKDSTISDLSSKITTTTSATEKEFAALKEKARIAEDSHHALVNKVSHMEALQNQFNELKKLYIDKEKELTETKQLLEELKSVKESSDVSKRKINIKKKEEPDQLSNKESDDF